MTRLVYRNEAFSEQLFSFIQQVCLYIHNYLKCKLVNEYFLSKLKSKWTKCFNMSIWRHYGSFFDFVYIINFKCIKSINKTHSYGMMFCVLNAMNKSGTTWGVQSFYELYIEIWKENILSIKFRFKSNWHHLFYHPN